jgi:FixJ family two-component response regulator
LITLSTVIHIVDDDTSFRTAIGRVLQASGYEVVLYESPNQLLDQLPDEIQPSCLLLDVQLPGLTGPELQNRLAELGSMLPIVFLTGHGDIPTSVEAIKAGAEDFLTKPVAKDKLVDAIERAIARYRAARVQTNSSKPCVVS